jgi:hypothetical protein
MAQQPSSRVGPIPIMVALWDAPHFVNSKRTIIASLDNNGKLYEKDNRTLEYIHYNRRTYAIGIHAGPQFSQEFARGYSVSFFEGENYQGRELCLAPGVYPTLKGLGDFGGRICSLKFNEPFKRDPGLYEHEGEAGEDNSLDGLLNDHLQPAAQIPSIPSVVRLIDTDNVGPVDYGSGGSGAPYCNGSTRYPLEMSRCLTLVESAYDFRKMFGPEYDATTRQVIVQRGPDYTKSDKGFKARLYDRPTDGDPDQPANLDFGPDDDTVPPSNALIGIAKGNWINLYTPPYDFDRRARAMRIVEGP